MRWRPWSTSAWQKKGFSLPKLGGWSTSKTYEIWIFYRWVFFFQARIQIFTLLLLLSYVACFRGWQEGGGEELTTCVPIITLTTALVCLTCSPLLCLLFVFIMLDPVSTYVCTAELLMSRAANIMHGALWLFLWGRLALQLDWCKKNRSRSNLLPCTPQDPTKLSLFLLTHQYRRYPSWKAKVLKTG